MRLVTIITMAAACVGGLPAWAAETATPATNAPAPPAAPKDTLEFLSGDQLHGSFLSLDGKSGVRWQHSSIKQVLTVNPEGVYKVRLPQSRANRADRPNCSVRLANGDEVLGNLVSLDEKELVLDTWFAGKLSLPRPSLGSLMVGLGRFNILYEGPTSAEGWNLKGGPNVAGGQVFIGGGIVMPQPAVQAKQVNGWQYKDGAFYGVGSGSLGRNVKLPPASSIEFDLAWRGYPQMSLFFYTDNLEGYGGNAYVMQFSYRNIYLRRQSQNGRSSNLGTIELPATSVSKTRFAIRTDRENKIVALFMDDLLVKQWMDNAEFNEAGTGILFYLQGGQQAMKVSNLRITEWDGRLDDGPAALTNSKEDLVRLANKDKVSGTLKSIRDGKISFQTAFAPLEVPLDRVTQVDFAPDTIKTNQFSPRDVRLFFADRGRLTMQVERWDDQQVVGVSGNFGQAKFLPSAFSAVQFNLDKKKMDVDSFDAGLNPNRPEMFIEE